MFDDTHFKATNTEPLLYRFGSASIFTQVWSEYLDPLNVGRHLFKFVIVVSHMVVKLKREAKSLELGIQIFIIILVTVSKNVLTGSVVNNI